MNARFVTLCAFAIVAMTAMGCPDTGTDGELVVDPEPEVEGPSDCATNVNGDCVLASDVCSPDDLTTYADGRACAECVSSEGESLEICGDRTTVQCSQLENAFGEPCQRCVINGMVLYDDCVLSAVPDGPLTCEQVEAADLNAGALDDGGSAVVDDQQDCEVCYDPTGAVVSTSCRPEADACETVVLNGRSCEQCTYRGELAYLECNPVDLDPDLCEVYQSDVGRCIDCYQQNALISHECILGDPGNREDLFCESYETFEGLYCTECFDTDGNLIDLSCEDTPVASFCEELFFEQAQQVCHICVDDVGNITESECVDLQCLEAVEDPAQCLNTSDCYFLEGANGELCRECPVMNADGFEEGVERECLSVGQGEIMCQEEVDFVEAPGDPDDPNGAPVVEELICVRCYTADGALVHEQCEGMGGQPAPPTCVSEIQPDGSECLVCTDEFTGDVVYQCDGPVCYEEVIDNQICWVCDDPNGNPQIVECGQEAPVCEALEGLPLTRNANEMAAMTFIAPTGEELEADLDCTECDEPPIDGNLDSAACTLREACGSMGNTGVDPDPGNPDVAPEPMCATDLYFYELPQCGGPWNPNGLPTGSDVDQLESVMAWMIDVGVVPHSASIYADGTQDMCDSCDCLSGLRLEVWVVSGPQTTDVLLNAGFMPG